MVSHSKIRKVNKMKHDEVRFCPSFERLVNAAHTAHVKNSHQDGGVVEAKNKGGKCSGIDKLIRMEKTEHMGKKHKR